LANHRCDGRVPDDLHVDPDQIIGFRGVEVLRGRRRLCGRFARRSGPHRRDQNAETGRPVVLQSEYAASDAETDRNRGRVGTLRRNGTHGVGILFGGRRQIRRLRDTETVDRPGTAQFPILELLSVCGRFRIGRGCHAVSHGGAADPIGGGTPVRGAGMGPGRIAHVARRTRSRVNARPDAHAVQADPVHHHQERVVRLYHQVLVQDDDDGDGDDDDDDDDDEHHRRREYRIVDDTVGGGRRRQYLELPEQPTGRYAAQRRERARGGTTQDARRDETDLPLGSRRPGFLRRRQDAIPPRRHDRDGTIAHLRFREAVGRHRGDGDGIDQYI